MEHHLNLVHNIPFFSIFFAMFCGIITPLIKNGRVARYIHGTMVAIVGVLSAVLLVNVVSLERMFSMNLVIKLISSIELPYHMITAKNKTYNTAKMVK